MDQTWTANILSEGLEVMLRSGSTEARERDSTVSSTWATEGATETGAATTETKKAEARIAMTAVNFMVMGFVFDLGECVFFFFVFWCGSA